MRMIFACLLSALVVAVVMAVYSIVENGLAFEVFGVSLIGFIYALAVAIILGLPFLYVAQRSGKTNPFYFAAAGALVGCAFMIVPLVRSGGADLSVAKTLVVLGVAGAVAGLTLRRVSLSAARKA
jgi:hypothetical protein